MVITGPPSQRLVKKYSIRGLGRERRCYRNTELSEITLLDRFDYSLDVRRAHEEIEEFTTSSEISDEAAESLWGKTKPGREARGKRVGQPVRGRDGQEPAQPRKEEVTPQPEPSGTIPKERRGKTVTAETAAGRKVEFYYAAVESGELITSHDHETMEKNRPIPRGSSRAAGKMRLPPAN